MSLKSFLKKKFHRCKPMVYPKTGEVMTFYWEVPWSFLQEFHVCEVCKKVKVLNKTTADNRSPLGGYRQEKDGKLWSGSCDYARVPSIGRDVLRVKNDDLRAKSKV